MIRFLAGAWGFLIPVCAFATSAKNSPRSVTDLTVEELHQKIEFYKYHNNDTAFHYAQELLERNKTETDLRSRLKNIGFIARVYIHLEYYDLALRLYHDILGEIEAFDDSEMLAEASHYEALLYEFMNEWDKSVKLDRRSLRYRSKENVTGLVNSFHGLGDSYRFLGNLDSSYYFLQMGFKNLNRIEDPELKGQVALSFAETLLAMDSVGVAKSVYQFVVDTLQYGTTSDLAKGYVQIVEGLLRAKTGDFDRSVALLLEALTTAKEMNYNYGVITIYRYLIPVLEQAGRFHLATQHLKDYHDYEMASIKRGQEKLVRQLEILHETQQKEQAIAYQQTRLMRSWIAIAGLSILIVLCLMLLFILNRNSIARKKMALNLKERNEKIELLMRELHHRVKNNLQVISSLLGLQSIKMEEGHARQAVEEGRSRVKAMAMIHQKLYRTEDLIGIDFQEYVTELVQQLKDTYRPQDPIEVDIKIPVKNMDVDTTLPLGLLINEMISNSFKYAFKDIEKPLLKIELLENEEQFRLIVGDNGTGLPHEFDFNSAASFGIKLIKMLTRQLNGNLEIKNGVGLQYELVWSNKK